MVSFLSKTLQIVWQIVLKIHHKDSQLFKYGRQKFILRSQLNNQRVSGKRRCGGLENFSLLK